MIDTRCKCQWGRWRKFPDDGKLPLHFGCRDTTFAAVGADYRLSDTLTLRGGIAYDQTPTTVEHRDVRVPGNSRKWLALGLGWQPSARIEYSVGYLHLFASNPEINALSWYRSTLVGEYEPAGDVLATAINYKF